MNNLPEKFPEHIIMYKILAKKIQDLNNEKEKTEEIQNRIKNYEKEKIKIVKMFPDNFFELY